MVMKYADNIVKVKDWLLSARQLTLMLFEAWLWLNYT